jgi:hypothetical protein
MKEKANMNIQGHIGPYEYAGTPGAGTDEVQTLTIGGTPTSGTFKLEFDGQVSSAIMWSATNNTLLANIQAALDAMANVGTNGIVASAGTLSSGIGTILLTFGANLTKLAVNLMTVYLNSLAGSSPTLAIAETTPGVTASFRGAKKGALVVDITNGKLYQNTGTALAPVWNSLGDIATAEIADDGVTGPKLSSTALKQLVFTGHNGTGACTLTGAKIGDKVIGLINITDEADGSAAFEATITVANQIQQSSASDYSAKKFAVTVVVKS